MEKPNLYLYNAKVIKVYDGDTITVNIDLGFDMSMQNKRVRLTGIDAPELRGDERPQGLESRNFLRDLILYKEVYVLTEKDKTGKYGRYLGTIFIKNNDGTIGDNINEMMITEGYATEYGKK